MSANIEIDKVNIENKLKDINRQYNMLIGQTELLEEQIQTIKNQLISLNNNRELYSKSVELLNLVQKETRDRIKEGFESIVTYALKYIFSNDYKFELEFGKRGNLQEIDFNIKTPGLSKSFDCLDSSGGGVLDIVSLALRVALLEIAKPRIDGFIALDETFKHLSEEHLERASAFLKAINERIHRQIIMVTHQRLFITNADNSIEVK